MSFGECDAEAVGPTVRIAVQLAGRALQRLERLWEGPERPFVRGELDDTFEAELTLNLFDRLARLVGDDSCKRGPEEAGGNVRHYEPGVVSSDFLRQNQNAPPAAASIDAIAPLFNPACSPVPGTAARALRFPNFFATFQTPQPSTAFRRLMIPMGLLSRKRAYQAPFPNRDRAHARRKDGLFVLAPAAPGMLHDRARQLETSRLGLRFLGRRGATGGVDSFRLVSDVAVCGVATPVRLELVGLLQLCVRGLGRGSMRSRSDGRRA